MKKFFVFIAAIVALAACSAPAPAPVVSNSNANSAKTVVPLSDADVTAKEKAAWEAIQSKNYDGFAAMLDSDAIEITPTDVNEKAATLAGVKEFEPTDIAFSDWKVVHLDNDAVVVTYTTKVSGKFQGVPFKDQSARASSAWVNRDGKWVSVYHQETPIPAKLPAPPPKASASPSASASPTGAPVATTGPDAIANEKIVWDLFKSKNYDGFASVLADDFIQVLETGVSDKANAVEIDRFDASKSELSEWKTLKIDDDAALVFYLVKAPGMKDERHTTFWTNRNGKWVARFHQGTALEKAPPAAKAAPAASPAAK
ncbi:MAG TPA: DUF4440 domain-containing protein [Pyrinomonadaceae bacterium]|nr:DUF4440 domain-containing protein [Pyrinomonadaceae bacterium]